MLRPSFSKLLALLAWLVLPPAHAIDSVFTYQGSLNVSGAPAQSAHDFQFTLQDEAGAVLATLTFDDVLLAGGVFSVPLDFGAAAFDGSRRYLQIGVRSGSSVGAYTALSPRTAITAVPYAQESIVASFAEGVASNTIAGEQVINGSLGLADINTAQIQSRVGANCPAGASIRSIGVDGSVVCETDDGGGSGGTVTSIIAGSGLTGGTITSSGTLAVNTAAVQARVTGECPSGQYMRQIQQAGGVACESVTTAAGTVRQIDTGAGLTGGPINVVGTLAIANAGVTTAMLAANAVGAAQVNASQVQLRVSGSCGLGDYLSGINLDGSVGCAPLPLLYIRNLDSTNDVGKFSDIALRADGRAVISYYDRTNGDLKFYECANASCASGTTRVADANANPEQSAILVRPSGRPLVAYSGTPGLRVYDCLDAACTSRTSRTLESGTNNGRGVSIAVRGNGRPLIAYIEPVSAEIRVFDCADLDCNSGSVRVIDPAVTTSAGLGQSTAIAVSSSGQVWVAWQDATPADVRLAPCTVDDCSSVGSLVSVDSANVVGAWLDMTLTPAGAPVLTYYDATSTALKLATCNSATACTAPTVHTLDNAGSSDVGTWSSVSMRSDGRPVIAYHSNSGGSLRYFDCVDSTCTTGNAQNLVLGITGSPVGQHSSMVLRNDDRPLIVHHDEGNDDLEFHLCANPACS